MEYQDVDKMLDCRDKLGLGIEAIQTGTINNTEKRAFKFLR